jgi:hypothetical protein
MAEQVPEAFRPALAAIVERLAAGDYAHVGAAGDLGTWIRSYPARLVPLPLEAWEVADATPIVTGGWSVVLPLWTAEEGRSDLTLTATAHESPLRITDLDVHVL